MEQRCLYFSKSAQNSSSRVFVLGLDFEGLNSASKSKRVFSSRLTADVVVVDAFFDVFALVVEGDDDDFKRVLDSTDEL